ncbi:MAG: hypothetical protein ACI4KR_10590 [Ruminiclostridium sp.]
MKNRKVPPIFMKGRLQMMPIMRLCTAVYNKTKNIFIRKISGFPLGEKFLSDVVFRTKVLLLFGLAVNLLYAAVQLVYGIVCLSIWSGALAVYYVLLAVMRFLLLKSEKNHGDNGTVAELQKYRLCGLILLFMTPIFASILILIVHKNSGAVYPGFMIYLMAIYAFCYIIIAAVSLFKFRKYGSPLLSAAKVVNLTVALISMLSLETAAMTRFGGSDDSFFRQVMTGTSCGAVCVLVLTMAIVMVVQGTKQLKLLRNDSEKQGGEIT